jgi:hypothetical protein
MRFGPFHAIWACSGARYLALYFTRSALEPVFSGGGWRALERNGALRHGDEAAGSSNFQPDDEAACAQ